MKRALIALKYLVLTAVAFVFAISLCGCGSVSIDMSGENGDELHGLHYLVPADFEKSDEFSNEDISVYGHRNGEDVDAFIVVKFAGLETQDSFESDYYDVEDLVQIASTGTPVEIEANSTLSLEEDVSEDVPASYQVKYDRENYLVRAFWIKDHSFTVLIYGNIDDSGKDAILDSFDYKGFEENTKPESIKAEYEGDPVTEGWDVDESDVFVSATYSDGTIEGVDGWIFKDSGEIEEVGTNTLTIQYEGCECEIKVEGEADSSDSDDSSYDDSSYDDSSYEREKVTCAGCNGAGWVMQGGYWLDGEYVEEYAMECVICDGQGWYYEDE